MWLPGCYLDPGSSTSWAHRPQGPKHLSRCVSCLARAAGMGDAMSSVALREMQKNTGFGQASRVSLHTKLWGRGCSLPTALGSRSTVKSYAQPKHYQGLTRRAAARCLALITFSQLSSQGPSTGGTCQRDRAQGAMATTCSLDLRNKFSPGKVVQDLAQK